MCCEASCKNKSALLNQDNRVYYAKTRNYKSDAKGANVTRKDPDSKKCTRFNFIDII